MDVAWSFATATLAAWFALSAEGYAPRRAVLVTMVTLWGARAQRNLFLFFQVQALWAVMFALPVLAAARNPTAPLGWLDAAGIALWGVSLLGESLADRQLARFKAAPANRGQVCRDGLWRYSRHPNYFFEWIHWWVYVCLAAGSPLWWIALAGVATMWLFLTKVTGIPPTEAQSLRSRGEAYREYQRTTNAFFPWAPKGTAR